MEGFTPAEEEIRAGASTEMAEPPTLRQRYIDGLRVLATVLENNEHVPLPYDGTGSAITLHFLHGEDPREEMAAVARAIPCAWKKRPWDADGVSYFDLDGVLGGLKVKLTAYRETVCKRVVVGTEEQEVDEVITPAVTKKVKKKVEKVEWDCGSLFQPRLPESAPKELAAQNGAAA